MEGGYDYAVVGEVVNDLNCVICLKLLRDAIQLECTHGMCNGCYKKLAQSALERYYNKSYIFYHMKVLIVMSNSVSKGCNYNLQIRKREVIHVIEVFLLN